MKVTDNIFYKASEWITRFAFLNILWLIFSLAGLVVFSFFPSTMAMFSVLRKWIMGDRDIPIFRTFWKYFKTEFISSNLMGVIILLISFTVYLNLKYIDHTSSNELQFFHVPIYVVMISLILTILYLFPTYTHYKLNFLNYFKRAFIIMFTNPVANLLMIVSLFISYSIMSVIPVIFLVFGGSITAYIIMRFCYNTFQKV
ncbi:DUF624 domain-containing protein [Aquibacillus halophilus]|uniref:DUF624 domain-containing protein n=1 Tax=Aquibacillus halophilus TaxID=930132 RepID=A0A6A8DIH6_9BACI|nr:DUF624 domain-containing protein [Aquibacillus halophilus]MRH43599.1 DUF624 domain-containing protein [Aquibacillus halophilus]